MEMNRRVFLGASAASACAVFAEEDKIFDGGFADVAPPGVPPRKRPLVPAGSGSLASFARSCVGCQLCISACPHDVLRPSLDPLRFSQPEMGFDRGWCRPNCTSCSSACPAGAIRPVPVNEKRGIHVGHAVWHKEMCLAAAEGVSCNSCSRHCPVKAVKLVPLNPSEKDGPRVPVVDADACIGCGACEHFCPARPLPAMTVEGYAVHRVVRPMSGADALAEARSLVEKGECSCVVVKDGVIAARLKGRDAELPDGLFGSDSGKIEVVR